jgi:UrcA family protein
MFAKTFFATALTTAAILGLAASAPASVAAASSDPDVISRAVFIGDLNLSSQAGAHIALRRIEAAASSICGEAPDLRNLDGAAPYHACIRSAVDQAVASLNSPIVTALRSPRTADVLASNR